LLLARVEANHIHFLARYGTALGDLPEANTMEKTDMIHGGEVGMALGAGLGLLAGMLAVLFPPWYVPVPWIAIPICVLIGALAGAWWTGMVASAIPNTRLDAFKQQIELGRVLMMVSVPLRRAGEIRDLVTKRHPEVAYGGTWPTDHVMFP
jgi:hypothetical protein